MKTEILEKTAKLMDNISKLTSNPGSYSEINTLFVGSRGDLEFVSQFARTAFLKHTAGKDLFQLWNKFRGLGNFVLGAIFQKAIEEVAQQNEPLIVRYIKSEVHDEKCLVGTDQHIIYSKSTEADLSPVTTALIENSEIAKKKGFIYLSHQYLQKLQNPRIT